MSDDESAQPLEVITIAVPSIRATGFDTGGEVPQVRGAGSDISKVNALLVESVVNDQSAFLSSVRATYGDSLGVVGALRGTYEVGPSKHSSASTTEVSSLLPSLALVPGGNDGEGWIGIVIDVERGRAVDPWRLLADRKAVLTLLARYAAKDLPAVDCVRESWRDRGRPSIAALLNDAAAPVSLALTSTGLAVGLEQGSFAAPYCGRLAFVVPYDEVTPLMTDYGKHLAAAALPPKRPRS